MKFNHRLRAHHYVVGAIAVLPLTLSVASASVVTTSAELGKPSPRPAVQTAVFAGSPLDLSRSSARFDLLDEGAAVDPGAAPGPVRRELKITSPKGSRTWTASALAEHDLPSAAARAYKHAARTMAGSDPACQLPWTLLAGIGRVESDHGRYGGSVLASNGVSHPLIIGVPLNGVGPVAAIADSDGGKLDGDTVWDRAVGPMQFIPTTWSGSGRDGDDDGVANPNDIDDATLAAAGYLCSGSGSVLGAGMRSAVYRYNQSVEYVGLVLAFEAGYRTGVFLLPSPPPVPDDEADQPKKKRKAAAAKTSNKQPVKKKPVKKAVSKKPAATKPKPSTAPRPTSSPSPKPSSKPSGKKPGTKKGVTKHPKPSEPSSAPSPTPTPAAPVRFDMTESLSQSGTGWKLGNVDLDFAFDLSAVASKDYDGDTSTETVSGELAGLAGRSVRLQVERGISNRFTVYQIYG